MNADNNIDTDRNNNDFDGRGTAIQSACDHHTRHVQESDQHTSAMQFVGILLEFEGGKGTTAERVETLTRLLE